ncbi:MAG TPA: type IV pilus secretin PilQ [Syntrophorhabdales bacterium]|nr:type IV pilus secretin PilQ [Syntrophorhabdales bacterium]
MYKRCALNILVVIMVPLLAFGQVLKPPASKVSFDFMDADVRNVLRVLSDVSKKNIVISEDVKGKVTVKLDNVTYDEALDVILQGNDLARIDEGSVIRIVTAKRFYDERDRFRKDRAEILKEKDAKLKLEEEFMTETLFLNYMDAAEVGMMLRGTAVGMPGGAAGMNTRGLLTPNGAASVVKWTNAVIIKDTKDNVQDLIKRIKELDIPPVQVQIEARIVQATTNFSRDLGIQWGAQYRTRVGGTNTALSGLKQVTGDSSTTVYTSPTNNLGIRDSTVAFPYNLNLPASPAVGTAGGLGIFIGGLADSLLLDVQLSALEAQGKGKIVSNPKVITSHNQTAKIAQGTQIPYQTVSQNYTQIEFKDAVLSLEVTPLVAKDGNIRLRIKATKDRPTQIPGAPVPGIDKKEATSEVLVKDGDTVVLGGIYESENDTGETGLPGLKNIPLLGWLFRSNSVTNTKAELLIFVTPTIIKNPYKAEG